jgi:hypothetical protein
MHEMILGEFSVLPLSAWFVLTKRPMLSKKAFGMSERTSRDTRLIPHHSSKTWKFAKISLLVRKVGRTVDRPASRSHAGARERSARRHDNIARRRIGRFW